MRVSILGAGGSAHAGYPLASQLGTSIASWVETLPEESKYHERVRQLRDVYGTLENFEPLITDLFTCPGNSPASALSRSLRGNILHDIEDAIMEYFNIIRVQPAPLYDALAQRTRHGDVV